MGNTIFISHATPEDNDFTIWLASRLEMLGYKTWIDKEGLLGGERFWPTIQKAINESAKVLLVYSKNIITNDGVLKQGIETEIEYAKSIARQNGFRDYIIPLNIDDSPYNLVIGSPNINHIPFKNNWADGLKQLLKKLEKDNVKKTLNITESSMVEWYENEYVSKCRIINQKELYYTSWWQIMKIPQSFFLYQFQNEQQAKEILKINENTITSRQSNIISTFESNLNYTITKEKETFDLLPVKKYSFTLPEILNGFDSDTFPTHRDAENYFKRLLSNVIFHLFKNKGLWRTELANKKLAFYLPLYSNLKPIRYHYPYSSPKKAPKRKSICGKFENMGYWHYAISPKAILFPFIGFSLKSHLIFTKDGFDVIEDKKKVHSYRRKKGKHFFNKEWRDMLLAFLQNMKDENDEIKIQVSKDNGILQMEGWTEMFWSDVGYNDPNSKMDIDRVDNYIEGNEEEEIE